MQHVDRNELILYAFTAICAMLVMLFSIAQHDIDAPTYFHAWDVLRTGGIDYFRTPVYPIVLGLVNSVFGENFMGAGITVLQLAMLFVSVGCFYRIASRFMLSRRIAFGLSLIYVMVSVTWINWIMTESLAISWTVFLLYYTIGLYRKFNLRYAIGLGVMLLLLLFLRPVFVYMLPVFLAWWSIVAILKKSCRAAAAAGIASVAITSFALFMYMNAFEKAHGRFAITAISMGNQIEAAKLYIKYDEKKIDDEVLRAELADAYEIGLYKVYDDLMAYYCENPKVFAKSLVSRVYRSRNNMLFNIYIEELRTVHEILMLRLPTLYLFLLLYAPLLVYEIISRRRILLLTVLIYGLTVIHVLVSIVGAQADYERLVLPVWPMVLLLFGQICARFRKRRSICMVNVED